MEQGDARVRARVGRVAALRCGTRSDAPGGFSVIDACPARSAGACVSRLKMSKQKAAAAAAAVIDRFHSVYGIRNCVSVAAKSQLNRVRACVADRRV